MRRKRRLAGALGLHNSVLLEEVLSALKCFLHPLEYLFESILSGDINSGQGLENIAQITYADNKYNFC